MPFANALKGSLRTRQRLIPGELAAGDSLDRVLDRHLLAVEAMGDPDMVTSILLLDKDRRRLRHGAAPNLPAAYRQAIDGGEIGPCAGSCGTAAYLGEPVYVTDIATDRLWADYRHLALPHGLCACWSTPIRDAAGAVIGTFAIYNRSVRGPTPSEIHAIQMITKYVAHAIICARDDRDADRATTSEHQKPVLRIVRKETAPITVRWFDHLLLCIEKLQKQVDELDRCVSTHETSPEQDALEYTTAECRRLIGVIRNQIERFRRHPGE